MPVPDPSPPQVRFRQFQLDLASGELHKDDQKIALPPKAFGVLRALVERPGEVVTREELRAKLWAANTFVEFDDSLNHAIKKLRQALGDTTENPQFIETLPRYGYRFLASIEGGSAMEPKLKRRLAAAAAVLGIALLALVVVLVAFDVGGWRSQLLGHAREPPIRSLAVLPLSNLTGDPQQDYFADGMTDALITDLAKIHSLKVISRTSVMQFKNVNKPLKSIAGELGVDGILEGSVQRSGERVRITAQLIRAPTDTHLWSESYERDTRDVLTLQAEVAQAVARQIKLVLTPEESGHLARARPVNPEAYRLYLIGRFLWNKRTEEGFKNAIDYFQRAIEIDPDYAPAYAGLADSYVQLSDWGFLPPKEAYPRGKAAAQKAVEIDPLLAEAHTSLGNPYCNYDWDWAAGEKEFQRAIELSPNYASAHQWYGEYLSRMGRHNEAIAEAMKARELDPLSTMANMAVGYCFYNARRYDEAIRQTQSVLPLFPEFPEAYRTLGYYYETKGSYEEALTAYEKAALFNGASSQEVAAMRHAYAKGGMRGYNLWALGRMKEESKNRYMPPYGFATLYVKLGEWNQAMAWLERAYQDRNFLLISLQVNPDFDALRSDPRFQDLLRRMNFPQ